MSTYQNGHNSPLWPLIERERERERENPMLVSMWVKGQGILDDTQIQKP